MSRTSRRLLNYIVAITTLIFLPWISALASPFSGFVGCNDNGPPFKSEQLSAHRNHASSKLSPHALALSKDDTDSFGSAPITSISHRVLSKKRVLVVGGSGRVGGSVVIQLLKHDAKVTVGGTRTNSFLKSQQRWKTLHPSMVDAICNVSFVETDREDPSTMSSALRGGGSFDLIVHTAGPFQGKAEALNGVLAAAVESGTPYIDVCDDYRTASAAKTKYSSAAIKVGVPCIISTGCWPGVSSLMAKQCIRSALKENSSLSPADLTVKFSFFTAGSGGAGSTLLVATFLILAEKALTIVNGQEKEVPAMRNYSSVYFGPIVGYKDVAHMNLLETASIHDALGIGNVETLFGTAPGFWNTLLGFMAQLPPSLLANEPIMKKLALFSLPLVRLVDFFAGATNAMRCEVTSKKDCSIVATTLYAHENLEPCVGECVASFCSAVLSKNVKPGVWFPEEAIDGGADAAAVLRLASVGAHTVEIGGTCNISFSDIWGHAKKEMDKSATSLFVEG